MMEILKIPKFLIWEELNQCNFKNSPAKTFLIPLIQDRTKKILMEALKSLSSRARKSWPHQVQFQEPTHIYLNYASNPGQNSKNLMEAMKYLSSRHRKR